MSSRNLILILATSGFASTFSGRAVEPMVGVIAWDLGSTPPPPPPPPARFASPFPGRAVEPMVGVIAWDLGSTPQTIALLSAAFALPYAFIQPVLGPIGDALGKERVMKVALTLLFLTLE